MTKKIFLMFLSIFLSVTYLSAQVVQTVNVPTAGGLATAIGSNLKTVTDLTLTGTINATDFQTIKQMTALKNLDMSGVNVVEKAIPAYAFQNRVLNSLMLPESIEEIGDLAFSEMQVPGLDFSKNTKLRKIGYSAFSKIRLENNILDFSKNKNFTQGGVHAYGPWSYGVFTNYNGHVILPQNMTTLFNCAFVDFAGSVDLPQGLTSIGYRAFWRAKPSEPILLPQSLTYISTESFANVQTSSLNLSKAPNLEEIGDLAFSEMQVPGLDFSKNTKLRKIGYSAFSKIRLENNILDFSKNKNFTQGGVHAYGPWSYGVFTNYNGHVILPQNMTTLFNCAFVDFAGSVDLPQGLTSIGYRAFWRAKPSEPILLPQSLTYISTESFANVQTSSLNLSKAPNLEEIGDLAFSEMQVPGLDFSKNTKLRKIGYSAFSKIRLENNILDFSKNENFTQGGVHAYGPWSYGVFTNYNGHVILPQNMTTLFNCAFVDFAGSVDLPQGLTSIGYRAFWRAKPSEPILLPQSLTYISTESFANVQTSSLNLSKAPNLEEIGDLAFSEMQVPGLDFSKNTKLRKIGYSAFSKIRLENNILDFSKNENFTQGGVHGYGPWSYGVFTNYNGHVILPQNMTTLFNCAFVDFAGSVDLPQGLTSIGYRAFWRSSIVNIELPSTVISIDTEALNNCTQLSKIISNNPIPPALGSNVFYGVNKTKTVLEVPKESLNLYGTAAQWKDFLNIKSEVPSKIKLFYSIGNSHEAPEDFNTYKWGAVEASYEAIRIGEYYWMNSNFNHKETWRHTYSLGVQAGFETEAPTTQERINKALDEFYISPSSYKITPEEFNKYYGVYYDQRTRDYMDKWGKMFENREDTTKVTEETQGVKGWGLPSVIDFRQLVAMSPFMQGNTSIELRNTDIAYGLVAPVDANPALTQYPIYDRKGGDVMYWYYFPTDTGGNPYGFNMMMGGNKQNGDPGSSSHYDDDDYNIHFTTYPGDILQLFHRGQLGAKDGSFSLAEIVDTRQGGYHADAIDYHWLPTRWCRRLTDEELGYKLYIKIDNIDPTSYEWDQLTTKNYDIALLNYMRNNNIPTDQTSIIKLGLNETAPKGYAELPHGYIRGFYVHYLLDKPNSTLTVSDIMRYAYSVQDYVLDMTDWGRVPGLTSSRSLTKSLISDEVVVPFKSDATITLYPNPVDDVLNISGDNVEKVSVYDMTGRQVTTAKNSNTISVSDLKTGTYIVKVLTANGESTHKVMKK